MASPALLRSSTHNSLYICARCAFRSASNTNKIAKRWVSMKYLARMADAEFQWQEEATKVRAGKKKSMLTILEERGLVHQMVGTRNELDHVLTSRRLGAYVGIDPTAPSLHVGHMLPLMSLFWMYVNGYHCVTLLGGATAKVGDPTDRLTTREKTPNSVKTANMANIHVQLKRLWMNLEEYYKRRGTNFDWTNHREIVNNNTWWNRLPLLEIIQVLGPGMRLGSMLARQTVKNKMKNGDGMSWAEFSYPLMQAWDWWHMLHAKGVTVQIGGSDQYGNITAGVDAIKYIKTNHPNPQVREAVSGTPEATGFTVPLLTTSSGQKFGKSAGNALWLDDDQTSAFELYGYFLRTSDADVGKYLRMFTFMPLEEIEALVEEHMVDPSKRKAQHKLASEFVELVHGLHKCQESAEQHRLLFQKGPGTVLPAREGGTMWNRPQVNIKLPRSVIYQKSTPTIFYAAGMERSKARAWRLINGGGCYVAGPTGTKNMGPLDKNELIWKKVEASWEVGDIRKFLIDNDLLMLRRGKPFVKIIQIVSDEEYALSDDTYPGMPPNFKQDVLNAMEARKSILENEKKEIGTALPLLDDTDSHSNIDRLLAEDQATRSGSG